MKQTIKRIQQMREERDWKQFHTPSNLAKSISIESGELLECFQWDNDNYDLQRVKEELADVMLYCLNMADILDLDPIQIMNEKMDMNEKKYPVSKSKGNAKKYTEFK